MLTCIIEHLPYTLYLTLCMQIHRPKIGGAQEDQTNDPKTADCNSSQPAGHSAKVSAGPSRYHQTYLEEAIVLPGTSD